MYILGHLGIGALAVRPWWRTVSMKWLLLGTVLPDLIDKPLYYALCLWTGRQGAAIGLISGTRTIGHTALFLIFCGAISWFCKSRNGAALSAGVATHLLLDNLGDLFANGFSAYSHALLWPLLGWNFPVMPYPGLISQVGHLLDFKHLVFEILGAIVLLVILKRSFDLRRIGK